MSVNPVADPRAALMTQLASLPPTYSVPTNAYLNKDFGTIQNLYANQQNLMIKDLHTLNGLVPSNYRLAPQPLAVTFRERIIYQIVPAAIMLGLLATFFSRNPEPVADGTNEDCTKTKEQYEKCKGYIPTFKARIDESMADWKACLEDFNAFKNCTQSTLANQTEVFRQIEACYNNTVN